MKAYNLICSYDDTSATEAEVDEIVRTNDKQRFALTEREGKKYIRANQGHTIQVHNLR